jgi:hypothetical protein
MRILFVLGLALAVAGCASAPGQRTYRSDRNTITLQDIESTDQTTALGVVRTLRPRWLQTRGRNSIHNVNPIHVYVDGTRLGGTDQLANIPAMTVQRIRFYGPTDAQARWGLNHTNGAIEVTTKSG